MSSSNWAIAWRSLRRRPTFLATNVLILSLGIAANTDVFSIVDATLLKPLPYRDPSRLVTVFEGSPGTGREGLLAPARIEDWNRMNRTFQAISGSYSESVTDTSGADPERLAAKRVAPRYFQVLEERPALGRYFINEEERENGPTRAVISFGLWGRRFHQSESALGSRLILGGTAFTIVGVAPANFAVPSIDLWLPAQTNSFLMGVRQARFFVGVGRLKPGVNATQAREDLVRVQSESGDLYPATDRGWTAVVGDLKENRVGSYRRALLLVLSAVALLFVIAIANTAALALTQINRRSSEFAIRAALGANRGHIALGALRESAIIATISVAAGAAVAGGLLSLLGSRLASLPRPAEITLDWRGLLVAALAGCTAAPLCNFIPVLQATRKTSGALFAFTGRGNSGEQRQWHAVLAAAQVALTVLLLSGAGLMLKTYLNLSHSDAGFQPSHAVTFHVGAAWDEDRARIGRMQEALLDKLGALPGVQAVGFANFLPASGATIRYQYKFGDQPAVTAGERSVTSDYFRAVGTQLVAGVSCPSLRALNADAPKALVNQRFVNQFLNGTNPIGRALSISDGPRPMEVIGVVGDAREDALNSAPAPYVYICIMPGGWPDPEYVVRTAGDSTRLLADVRTAVHDVDPGRAVFGLDTLAGVVDATLDQPRLDAQLVGFFAIAALLLTSVGIYSLVTLIVISRTREIGVRMALGASPGRIVRETAGAISRLLLAGMCVGLLGAAIVGRALRSLLFGVTPMDPVVVILTLSAIAAASMIAALLPAIRAARIDPVVAVRAE